MREKNIDKRGKDNDKVKRIAKYKIMFLSTLLKVAQKVSTKKNSQK